MFFGDMFIPNHLRARQPALRFTYIRCFVPGLLVIAGLASGCASSSTKSIRAGAFQVMPTPAIPLFLNGPMALLLTNADGFRARVVFESAAPSGITQTTAGELMVRGSKLLFAPEPTTVAKKQSRQEDTAFIWDVNENRGYMLNDPLQAYAPISSSRQFTNVSVGAGLNNTSPEKVAGHLSPATEVTVTASDGVATIFRVWRATDLKGLPFRIQCPSGGVPLTLTLSKVNLGAVPNDLFLPPNGFTKYESPEAMMTEMALRRVNLSHKKIYNTPDIDEPVNQLNRAPTRSN
jgi:hypothetical protein